MTLTEFIFNKLPTIDKDDPYYKDIIEQAKQIEKSKEFTFSKTEISDDEIMYAAYRDESVNIGMEPESAFIDGAKWYREQLKKK